MGSAITILFGAFIFECTRNFESMARFRASNNAGHRYEHSESTFVGPKLTARPDVRDLKDETKGELGAICHAPPKKRGRYNMDLSKGP